MPRKKTKRITIREITDAFYSGVSPKKIAKMAQQLVDQENNKLVIKCRKDI